MTRSRCSQFWNRNQHDQQGTGADPEGSDYRPTESRTAREIACKSSVKKDDRGRARDRVIWAAPAPGRWKNVRGLRPAERGASPALGGGRQRAGRAASTSRSSTPAARCVSFCSTSSTADDPHLPASDGIDRPKI